MIHPVSQVFIEINTKLRDRLPPTGPGGVADREAIASLPSRNRAAIETRHKQPVTRWPVRDARVIVLGWIMIALPSLATPLWAREIAWRPHEAARSTTTTCLCPPSDTGGATASVTETACYLVAFVELPR